MYGRDLIVFNSLLRDELFADFMKVMEGSAGLSGNVIPGNGSDCTGRALGAKREVEEEVASSDESAVPRALLCSCFSRLMDFSVSRGYYGNLFHTFIVDLVVNDENFFALSCEKQGKECYNHYIDMLYEDFEIIRNILSFDFISLMERLGLKGVSSIFDFEGFGVSRKSPYYSTFIRDAIVELSQKLAGAADGASMGRLLWDFYNRYGVGDIGLHKAFRLTGEGEGLRVLPIRNITHVQLDDLIGYESAKRALVDNTEAFIAGKPANNCLLYGDAGTGKSTSIKALANEYYKSGLRIIEVYRHQFRDLHSCMSLIKGRNYKFILYLDDLSFEEFETEYKYLKAVIEGGLEVRPENILIYATSNRRHLVRESFRDREEKENDLHINDTIQEKVSLASRFGTAIYFGSPDRDEYYSIVKGLAKKSGLMIPEKELLAGANRFELSGSGRSGRTARQYIDTLLGDASQV